MTCEERRDLMLLYSTGALEPAEETELRQHLARGCAVCAGALAEAETTIHQIPRSLPPRVPPESAWDDIETRIALREQMEQPERMAMPERIALAQPSRPVREEGGNKKFIWLGWAVAAGVAVALGMPLMNAMNQIAAQEKQIATLNVARDAVQALESRVAQLSKQMETMKETQTILQADYIRKMADSQTKLESLLRSSPTPWAGPARESSSPMRRAVCSGTKRKIVGWCT